MRIVLLRTVIMESEIDFAPTSWTTVAGQIVLAIAKSRHERGVAHKELITREEINNIAWQIEPSCRRRRRELRRELLWSFAWDLQQIQLRKRRAASRRRRSQRCGAIRGNGKACPARALANGRCKFHGGCSTGPRTEVGRRLIAEAQQRRWSRWREERASRSSRVG